ncbi:MAG: hypothetical protein IKH27_10570 [Oscillospiraceae bacterium]|nr:hypothetical protein [Oscillospiraceae bacterium]
MPKSEYVTFGLADVISFLKDRDFSPFSFESDGDEKHALVFTEEVCEIRIDNVSDNVIPEETVRQVLDVLEHLDEWIQKGYDRIGRLDLKQDKWFPGDQWFPHELDKIFEVIGVTFEKTGEKHHFFKPGDRFEGYCLGHDPEKPEDGFVLEFAIRECIDSRYFPLVFYVKFVCGDMRAYAVEAEIF